MRDPIILLVHLIATLARLMGPGGLRSVVAESLLVKHQLLILNRSRHRAPNLRVSDRILAGVCALFMRPARVFRSAIVLRPSTILNFHRTLRQRKYRLLFSPKRRRTGPKGPPKDLVDAIVDMKRRNPRWGCPRIAQQIALAFAVDIDKDVVRRVLATHYRPAPRSGGPSWLTFLGHAKDSLWSIDLFRCESATLRSPLGAGGDGPRHATDRRLWHPCWNRGWPRPVPHVQPCDSRALASEAPQLRQRPAVSVSPMVRQPAGAAGDRGEECAVCAAVASVCRTVDRHAATRMRGSTAVLVCVGPGRQTGGLPGLLQCASGPCVVGRADARPDTKGCRTARPLPLGRALPRTLSDADRGVNLNSEDGGERGDAPACRVCRVPAIAQQGSTSATHLTHAIARTSRMVPAPAT